MRFLVDQNVPLRIAAELRAAGLQAVHTSELGLQRAEDADLMKLARAEDRIIITFDSDFSRMLALGGDDAPSVIHLRIGPADFSRLGAFILNAVAIAGDSLAAGAVVAVAAKGVRIRRLPLR